ncbi:MAG: hypothetical protein JNK04_16800 [Myxococcales bacterium]|nr:hypothetical protein [Myxococcales bacterium]
MRNAGWVVVALLFACVGEEPAPPVERSSVAVAAPSAALSAETPPLPPVALDDVDELRDPFEAEKAAPVAPIERVGVVFPDTPVRNLKVSGTIDGVGDGRAILEGPDGETQVLSVGARVGQLEKSPDGVPGQWRIDSVRNGRVYLLRDGGAMQGAIALGDSPDTSGRKRSSSADRRAARGNDASVRAGRH